MKLYFYIKIKYPYIHIHLSKIHRQSWKIWHFRVSLLRFACASYVPTIPFKVSRNRLTILYFITYKISRWTMVEENKNGLKSLADFTKWSNRKGLMQIAYYMIRVLYRVFYYSDGRGKWCRVGVGWRAEGGRRALIGM